jgi:hypothetical protein
MAKVACAVNLFLAFAIFDLRLIIRIVVFG